MKPNSEPQKTNLDSKSMKFFKMPISVLNQGDLENIISRMPKYYLSGNCSKNYSCKIKAHIPSCLEYKGATDKKVSSSKIISDLFSAYDKASSCWPGYASM